MSEPSPEAPGPQPTDDGTAALPRPAAGVPGSAARSKGPPQDPEAFQRWIGIERLKVDMRRLELEQRRQETPPPPAMLPHAAPAARPVLPILYGVVLVAVLGLAAFLAAQVMGLREEIGALRTAQTEMAARLTATAQDQLALRDTVEKLPAAAPQTAPPAAAPPATTAPPLADPGNVPLDDPSTQPSGTDAAAPPAQPGTGYTVRIFAPINAVTKARVDAFTAPLKAQGYDVVVSDTGVVQTTSNTLSYHASTEDTAKQLSALIQRTKPALSIEVRPSSSIPATARQVLILNLTEDALN